jgi:hypothetical protein
MQVENKQWNSASQIPHPSKREYMLGVHENEAQRYL